MSKKKKWRPPIKGRINLKLKKINILTDSEFNKFIDDLISLEKSKGTIDDYEYNGFDDFEFLIL